MLIRDTDWEAIREQFSEDEKSALRKAVTGEAICPKGFILDETKLDVALEFKITQTMTDRKTVTTIGKTAYPIGRRGL